MGNLIDIQPIRFASSARTDTDTGNYLRIARANTVNNAVGSLTVTGHLASLSSNCTQTSGTCTDSSSILSLTQSYPNATGAVLTVTNSGTGSAATFTGGNVGVGTTSPTARLHVTGANSTSGLAPSAFSVTGGTSTVAAGGAVGISAGGGEGGGSVSISAGGDIVGRGRRRRRIAGT
jgi:hypothetical protein